MLGRREHAQTIYDFHVSGKRKPPDGFRHIGSGGTRSAYLGPDGVVYKVGDSWCNQNEANSSQWLRRRKSLKDQEIHIAETRAIYLPDEKEVVNAQQYVEALGPKVYCRSIYNRKCNCRKFGTPRICFGLVYEILEDHGIEDMYYGNIIYAIDKKFYIIDLGFQE